MALLIILAHPSLATSRINKALLRGVQTALPTAHIRDLYHLYPHGFVDVAAEQAALETADTIVLQHPFYWYSVPSLMKEWIDTTLTHGWAFGEKATALKGKTWTHAISTGTSKDEYGSTRASMAALTVPLKETAILCHTKWVDPFVTHGAGTLDDEQLIEQVQMYHHWLRELCTTTNF
jgi:putative NADPH-quinone reductase